MLVDERSMWDYLLPKNDNLYDKILREYFKFSLKERNDEVLKCIKTNNQRFWNEWVYHQ